MTTIKKTLLALMMLSSSMLYARTYVDVYDVAMKLHMPRVYDNTKSKGYRKYQAQTITGKLYLTYSDDDSISSMCFGKFVNQTHKINGKSVTYEVFLEEDSLSNFSWCGNNKTGVFKQPNCNFVMQMVPSYKIGDQMLDDVHLSVACTSSTVKNVKHSSGKVVPVAHYLKGYCTGQIGCNCREWGHMSPTRTWCIWGPSCYVTDVASVCGQIQMKLNYA